MMEFGNIYLQEIIEDDIIDGIEESRMKDKTGEDLNEKSISNMKDDDNLEDVHVGMKEVVFEDEDKLIEVMYNDNGDLVEVIPDDDEEVPVKKVSQKSVDDVVEDISDDDEKDCCEMTLKQKQVTVIFYFLSIRRHLISTYNSYHI